MAGVFSTHYLLFTSHFFEGAVFSLQSVPCIVGDGIQVQHQIPKTVGHWCEPKLLKIIANYDVSEIWNKLCKFISMNISIIRSEEHTSELQSH